MFAKISACVRSEPDTIQMYGRRKNAASTSISA